ncbi:conjugal transfer protein TraR [Sphingomonas koreensis]|uniref:conjugal transfer protein TraR n=1 Tax=Sphingomonas koreensis TaxID=93064 RepID=UPI000F7F3BBF|nr:conjugal transfer protein TraR [Sphingomonas koreensis]RSU21221.1 conjugal transfer protein TraR [Sphingomonas koreensis]RSU32214.1 conjugal transfer protein TraR [Sphingomonas koreensis]RSU35708.1 conjugal transfer protein TraR [Sphingomonas koreensis]RSU49879.1 conjugal transfer protein TraR [Sphingomonas koreensis]RSU83474.1 conjugal transfer protein TraR [Sphingomonas koreensis]
MADLADLAQRNSEVFTEAAIFAARVPVAAGVAGICSDCGDDTLRLIDGKCAPCREPVRLPRRY